MPVGTPQRDATFAALPGNASAPPYFFEKGAA
jgi:hypothetical protein